MKTDVNVSSKSNTVNKKTLEKNLFSVGILSYTDEKSRIRIRIWIRMSAVRICGSGSVSKRHGSTTLPSRM
jgi:hypothetical protein